MTSRHNPDGMWFGFARGYGYLWWLGRSSIDRRNIDWAGSFGWGGQRLYAVPEFGLVVAVTAGAYGSSQGGPPAALENLAGDTALTHLHCPRRLGVERIVGVCTIDFVPAGWSPAWSTLGRATR
jgi:CubicO group peptidase (beta-lactamase class C family)